jgi:hypothetical protein
MAAATRLGNSIMFDAVSDTYTGIVFVRDITFQGTGLTPDQIVSLLDGGDDPVADFAIPDTTANAQLWNGPPKPYHNLKMTGTVAGTWKLTVFVE